MNKKLLFLIAFPALLSLSSCGGENIPNQGEVDKFKALLNKQDLSIFYDKYFVTNFNQDYSFFNYQRDDEDISKDFYNYAGGGTYGYYYSLTEQDYEKIVSQDHYNTIDFLSLGNGHSELAQFSETNTYQYDSTDFLASLNEHDRHQLIQQVSTAFTPDTYQIYNMLYFTGENNTSLDTYQTFNGIINKDILFNSISTRALADIFAKVNLYGGPEMVQTLDDIYYQIVNDLLTKTDKEISDFIINNHIVMDYDEEENTIVTFEIDDDNVKAILDENDIIPGQFKGTLTYEKDTGKYINFDYSIHFVEDEPDENKTKINSASIDFTANGFSTHDKYEDDPYIDPDVTVYEDGDAFVNDVAQQVIPPAI